MGQERHWLQAVITAGAICLLSVSQGVATLVQAREGGFAELDCNLDPISKGESSPNLFPLHVVEWVRLGYNVPILIKFGVYAPRVHPNYKGRVSLTRGASLLVERLTQEDEGWFECRILLLDSKTDDFQNGTWTFLSITAPPVFIKTPPTFVEVLLGDSLTLSCGAHGNPRPTVVWHKDENPIEKHEKIKVLNGSLSLASVTRNISGVYKCHVSNSEGNLTHSTQLQVKGPPIILISPEDTTLNMSQDAVLQCQADAYPSNLTYEWMKQGQNVYHIESLKSRVKVLVDGTLLIPNLIPEDAGNYTCIPTNGILTPPSASAHLKVKHPARVTRMPRETYLPAGMEGVIVCPIQADPPVLYVNWTKDGNHLNLDNFPGWMVNSEGSVFIARANDNAVGMYTCTPYNSYGTMGQSEPTKVILKDPPTFKVPPRPEYLQEVGRELIIPCEAFGDPSPNITWSKIGPTPRSPITVLTNGSLLLQPLSKDHQGGWECLASNPVATVSAGTVVMVLGTSPHSVSSVTVKAEMNQANVSWVPGFDGGFTQKFTVWVKQASRGKHEWASLPVPTSKNYLLVTGLLAGTNYQFSVLPQNKLGSGPFSEIVSVQTIAVPTEAPSLSTFLPLDPPIMLAVNRTSEGVVLGWLAPETPSSPVTGYVLQARKDHGQWVIITSNIGANQSELLVKGLLRDSNYDLRLLSRSYKLLSVPSNSVNVSTMGMDVYPLRPSFLEKVPESLLAGVIAGMCFLFATIVLSLVTACYMSHRRQQRRKKRRGDLPNALLKSSSPQARSPPRSPDSVLKLKLCPPLPFFPSVSSSHDRSSFEKGSRGEYYDQRKQLLSNSSPPPHYTMFESHLGSQAPSPTALESISRGPDGRFIVQPQQESSNAKNVLQNNGSASGSGSNRTSFRDSPKSSILSSEKDERKNSSLTVDVPELGRPPASPGRVRAMARNLSRHGCFYSDDEQSTEALLERASFYSDNSEKKPSDSLRRYRMLDHAEELFPSLGRRGKNQERDGLNLNQSREKDRTLVSQLDTNLELDTINKCVQLVEAREGIEKELEAYTAHQQSQAQSEKTRSPHREAVDKEPVWKLQEVSFRQKHKAAGQTSRISDYRKACYFGSTSSPMDRLSMSRIHWDISPVTSVTSLVPVQSPRESSSPRPALSHTVRDSTEDSVHADSVQSPVTQNTSLPLTPDFTSESLPALHLQSPQRDRSLSPVKPANNRRSIAGTQPWDSAAAARPYTHRDNTVVEFKSRRDSSPSSFSTLPYHERETEGVRTCSRKSDKCLISDSPSPITTLTLVEEVESDQSQLSVPRMSGFKAKPVVDSPKMSPMQTSAILEYLSLPGFIEMSVDEPVEESESTESQQSSEERAGASPVTKPDVVPKNWEVHVKNQESESHLKGVRFEQSLIEEDDSHIVQEAPRDPLLRVRFPDENVTYAPEKTCRQLYDEKTQLRLRKTSAERQELRLGSSSAHTLYSTAKGMADIVAKHSSSFVDSSESFSEVPQRSASQGSRANNIVSRISQAPVPFLKKSLSIGPCRTLSGMGPPRFMKKSLSLGAQRWEHFESPRPYVSERCYWDEFPSSDARVKSYSLGRTPPSFMKPGPSWREYMPFRRPSVGSLERSHHPQRSLVSPPYLTPAVYPPRQTSASPLLEPCDPRRQAAVFPECSRWSPSFEESMRPPEPKYVPTPSCVSVPQYQQWPGSRGEYMRPIDYRRGPQRSYLPRGISWPSPYYPPCPTPCEGEPYRHTERMMGRPGDLEYREVRDGGRASYASQSSGRGSAGLYRQSLSITPTLLSSPETTEESERHMEQSERRAKRRNTSVDESYEWDSTDVFVDVEVLEAMRLDQSNVAFWKGRHDQCTGLQDHQQKGQCPSVSPPVLNPPRHYGRSLSEERFNALRQEYHEFRRAQESTCYHGNDSDSEASSALL
ncbi:protein turtle homolog A isoform X1 [Boleophthalmus pectinirostris]|uniref:protein turtle homolog A isoform X1 n=1 Tax=Boleophthalmus pectinirostris TaxID=150288 RepID=UPI0024304D02|nr:protein turtle homolog A isoform X1 [Boleophthalmus pectinirostris]